MPTLVQKAQSADGTGVAVGTVSVSFSAVGSGNLVCGSVVWGNQTITATVADNNSVSATVVDTVGDSVNHFGMCTFYMPNVTDTPAPTSLTATFSSNVAFVRIQMQEWSGVATSSPLDGHTGQVSTGTTISSGNYTTTQNGDLLYGAAICDTAGSITWSAGGSYSLQNNSAGPNLPFVDESQIQSSASSSTSASFGLGASSQTGIVLGMAFKPPSSGSTPVFTLMSTRLIQ